MNTLAHSATAVAHPNIALIKYWGKRDVPLNLPAAGSISLTLAGMETRTTVRFDPELTEDAVELDGAALTGKGAAKISAFLDRVRAQAGIGTRAHVTSANDFPTAAGLASSASGFAALALAATRAAGLELDTPALSVLSRLGSGSAARSVIDGWARMHPGKGDDGLDAFATQIAGADHWDLRCVVAVCARGPKAIGSTEAMNLTLETSPYYDAWIADVTRNLDPARDAILARDFDRLAQLAEASCLRMHACALAADPGILYWQPATMAIMRRVRALRGAGEPVFFTIDAGPHVKVFCPADREAAVLAALGDEPSVERLLVARPGGAARLI
jgi:diphosphomevalonate decarboxylase